MQKYLKLLARIIVFALMATALTVFGAMVLAQDGPENPEDVPGRPNLPLSPHDVEEIETLPEAEAPHGETTLFKSFAGIAFHARESTTTQVYSGAGCVHRASPSGSFVTDLQLPDGAEIDFVRLYFNDTNLDANAILYLYAYDGAGDFTQIQEVSSSGTPGYSSVGSDFFSYEVDNAAASLALVAGTTNGPVNDSTVAICGARVRYNVDVPSFTLLPAFLKDFIGGG